MILSKERKKSLIDRISTKSFVVVMGIIFVLTYILSNTLLESYLMSKTNGNTFVEANIFYASEFGNILQAYGEIGRAYYMRIIILFDFIFPLQYGLFFASWLILLLKKIINLKWQKVILVLGFVLCLTDWLENAFILSAILSFPEMNSVLPIMAQAMTLAKATLTILFMIAIFISAAMLSIKKIKEKNKHTA